VFGNDEAIDFASRALALGAPGGLRFELLLVREAANATRRSCRASRRLEECSRSQ